MPHETNWYGIGPATDSFYKTVKMNSLGYRGEEFTMQKDNSTIRIAVIGDSFVFGAGVIDESKIMTNLLQKKLDDNNKKFEVINLGRVGAQVDDYTNTLNNTLEKLRPDLVIVCFFINDLGEGDQSFQYSHFLPFGAGDWLFFHSYTYYFFETRIKRLAEVMGFKKSYEVMMADMLNKDSFYNSNRHKLEALDSVIKRKNTNYAIAIFPLFHKLDNYPFKKFHNNLKNEYRKKNVDVIDFYEVYSGFSEEDLKVNSFDYHPSELAHRLAEEELYRYIIRLSQ